jgi:hypothetical protein
MSIPRALDDNKGQGLRPLSNKEVEYLPQNPPPKTLNWRLLDDIEEIKNKNGEGLRPLSNEEVEYLNTVRRLHIIERPHKSIYIDEPDRNYYIDQPGPNYLKSFFTFLGSVFDLLAEPSPILRAPISPERVSKITT